MSKKLLLLEFNELCPLLLEQWMAADRLPNFKRFRDESQVYITLADAEPPALEPWIQWYSIHTGLSYAQHRVFRLADGPRADHPDVWTVLQEAGLKTASCSSMNCKSSAAPGCFFLPDPWSDARAFPEAIELFHRFISVHVREHTRPEAHLRPRDALEFMSFLAGHGLRMGTIAKVMWQLGHETLATRDVRWKRAAILDLLQFDLFAHYLTRLKPDFSTFFLNSTAHLQHAYWRHMDPSVFEAKPDHQEMAAYQNAIFYGYECMDLLLHTFFELAERENVTLALATGLSQKPFLQYEKTGGQRFYRPRDLDRLLGLLTISPKSADSVMANEYVFRFECAEEQVRALDILKHATCEGEPVFDVHADGDVQLYLGSRLHTTVSDDALLLLGPQHTLLQPFHEIFYLVSEKKSGCHHPEGLFWLRTGVPAVHSYKISILDLFPTILEFLGIDYQPSDAHPYHGQSRVCDWQIG